MWEPNELLVFDSVERAETWTEPPDVDAGVAYDAEGRLLGFQTDGHRTFLHEREPEPTHEQELRTAIVQASLAVGTKLDASAPTRQLVEEAVARFRVD